MKLYQIIKKGIKEVGECFYSTSFFDPYDAYFRKNDRLDCYNSSIPSDEDVTITLIWSFEVYTAETIYNFVSGIKDFKSHLFQQDKYEDKILKRRESSLGMGWYNCGSYSKKDNPHKDFSFFQRVHFYIYQFTSSITLLLSCFELEENNHGLYANIINSNYKTYTKQKENNVIEYIGPYHQKQREVTKARRSFSDKCSMFIKENMTGFYASLPGYNNPCWELLIFNKWDGSSELSNGYRSYIGLLGLQQFDSWRSKDIPLFFSQVHDEKGFHYSSFAVNKYHFPEERLEYYCGENLHEIIAQYFIMNYYETLFFFGLYYFVYDASHRMGEIKEKVGNIQDKRNYKTLELLTNEFYNLLRRVSLPLFEIKNSKNFKYMDIHELYPASNRRQKKELKETILYRIGAYCDHYKINEDFIEKVLSSMNMILHSRNTLQLARSNKVLQVVMVILTAVMLITFFIKPEAMVDFLDRLLDPLIEFLKSF